MGNFKDLGVRKDIVKGLKELGIIEPTTIQLQTIPQLLNSDRDLVGMAQTGTGKTAAFGVPVIQRTNPNHKVIQSLILAPTRELCQQIAKQLFRFTKYTDKIFVEAVYGGAPINEQKRRLSRPTHIIVATPGRLMELVEKKVIDLENVKQVVLDEADEMLNMGFRKDMEKILKLIPKPQRSVWLFSATMPNGVLELIKTNMAQDALHIRADKDNQINQNIEHRYFECTSEEQKTESIMRFIRSQEDGRGVIFCRLKSQAKRLAKQLASRNITADAIQGDMNQKERDKVMRAFKNESLQILVATDIAARGIDVQDLAFVLHFQLPEKVEFYTHRSGRTARGGKTGLSLSFVTEKELGRLKDISQKLNFKLTVMD